MCDFFRLRVGCSLPGSSVHGISQARTLEWAAISFSRGSSRPRDWTPISCICRRIPYHPAIREAPPTSSALCYNPMSWSTHNAPQREVWWRLKRDLKRRLKPWWPFLAISVWLSDALCITPIIISVLLCTWQRWPWWNRFSGDILS